MISSYARRRNRQWTVTAAAALTLAVAAFCLQEALAIECLFGFRPVDSVSNSSHCEQFNCTTKIHPLSNCENLFPSSHCNPNSSRCECNRGFQLDEQRLQCVQNVTINSSCSSDLYCRSHVGTDTQCKESKCSCKLGYIWNDFLKQCAKDKNMYTLNFQTCTSYETCGENAFCDQVNGTGEGICKCNFNCASTSNRKDCAKVECRSDYSCRYDFQFKNSVCQNSECKCKPGYKLYSFAQTCEKVDWRRECTRKSDCGPNAMCFVGTCKCNLGFIWDEDHQRCNSQVCTFNSDCSNFYRTKCDSSINRCVCENGLEVDPTDQECTRPFTVETTTTTTTSGLLGECIRDSQCVYPFVCNNNRCQCPMGMYHDQMENICLYFDEHYSHHSSNVGLIIGSTVGGLAVLVIVITVICCICKKRTPTAGRVLHPRPPVQVHNVQPSVTIAAPANSTATPAVQPSAPAVTPPTVARSTFQHPQQQQFQVPVQPSYNPYYNAPPPSYIAATASNFNDGVRVYPGAPKSDDGIRIYPSLPKH